MPDTARGPGRRIALYPGAFRPPHKVHFAAMAALAARADIDEVIVIIAGRCRCLPGTTLALDAEVARQVLTIYLQDLPNVSIEVAAHSAVEHAKARLATAAPGDTLVLCIGEDDARGGDDRFASVQAANAVIERLPTGGTPLRATLLRGALARGDAAARNEFDAAQPAHLSAAARDKIWRLCRDGARPFNDIVVPKLQAMLRPVLGDSADWQCEVAGKLDPVFRVTSADGRRVWVKYAGETAEAGRYGERFVPKPRRRLSAERRAIRLLRERRIGVEVADILHFDRATSTLVLSEVCPGGQTLQEQLSHGVFDLKIAAALGHFVAACHMLAGELAPLQGDRARDLRQWQAMLALLTTAATAHVAPLREGLLRLALASEAARSDTGLFILDLVPKNIRISTDGTGIGVIDLERCSGVGDRACDVGVLLGHVLLWGLHGPRACRDACSAAIEAFAAEYRQRAGALWDEHFDARIAAFAGAGMLSGMLDTRMAATFTPTCAALEAAAAELLKMPCGADAVDRLRSMLTG